MVIDVVAVGHFKHQMKQKIIDFYISLLIIELLYLQYSSVLGQGHLHLFPNFKLTLNFNPNTQMERVLCPFKSIAVSHCAMLHALLSDLQYHLSPFF
jgi:hypothetical protein